MEYLKFIKNNININQTARLESRRRNMKKRVQILSFVLQFLGDNNISRVCAFLGSVVFLCFPLKLTFLERYLSVNGLETIYTILLSI